MATSILSAQPPSFDLRPTIIPPTPGDLEKARIERLVDLAKLRELTLAPGFEQQRLNLAGQAQTNEQKYRTGVLGETQAHNVAEEKHWADLLGLDQKKLQETAREHDSALGELTDYHKGVLKNQLAGDFMAHLAPLYAGDPTKVAAATGALTPILDKLGLSQITAGLQLATQQRSQELAKTTLGQISLARSKNMDVSPIVESLKNTSPDAYALIKNQIPTTPTGMTDTRSTATRLGDTIRKATYYGGPLAPFTLSYEGLKGVAAKVDKKGLYDLSRALTNSQ